jgi:ribonuclease HI
MIFFTDGFTIGSNPSDEGGYTIMDEKGKLLTSTRIKKSRLTNNETELLGVYHCLLDYAKEGDVITTDSMNTIYWCRNGKSKARQDLNDLMEECKNLLENKKVSLEWCSRDDNMAGWYNEMNYNEPEHDIDKEFLDALHNEP